MTEERGSKRLKPIEKCTLLNLHLLVPWEGVRRMIYKRLTRLDLAMVWWAHGVKEIDFDVRIHLYDCATHGYLSLFQFLYEKCRPDTLSEWVMVYSARYGHLDIVKWVHSIGLRISPEVLRSAAIHGRLEIVKWLVANGCTPDVRMLRDIYMFGQMDVHRFLRKKFPFIG